MARALLVAFVCLLAVAAPAAAQAGQTPEPSPATTPGLSPPPAGGLQLGFADGVFAANPLQNPWYARAKSAGADLIDLTVDWGAVAPNRPGGDATDPANPAYNFSAIDAVVRASTAAGMGVLLRI